MDRRQFIATGAAALWRTLPGDPEAVCRLAEHHLRAGRHAEALQELGRERPGARASATRIEDRWGGHAPDLRAWQAWIAGEVAHDQGRRDDARRYFAVARIAPGWRGRWAMLRLAEIAIADDDALAARSWLAVLEDGPPDEVTEAARRLRHDHAGLLGGAPLVAEVPAPRPAPEVLGVRAEDALVESARIHDPHAG